MTIESTSPAEPAGVLPMVYSAMMKGAQGAFIGRETKNKGWLYVHYDLSLSRTSIPSYVEKKPTWWVAGAVALTTSQEIAVQSLLGASVLIANLPEYGIQQALWRDE